MDPNAEKKYTNSKKKKLFKIDYVDCVVRLNVSLNPYCGTTARYLG